MTAVESFDDTPVEITITLPRCDAEGVVEVLRKAHWHQSADAIEDAIEALPDVPWTPDEDQIASYRDAVLANNGLTVLLAHDILRKFYDAGLRLP